MALAPIPLSSRTAPLLGGTAILLGAAIGAGVYLRGPATTCSLPPGELATLAPRDRGFAARRILACDDVEHGRISADAYRARVAELDAAWAKPAAPPALQWAASVIDVSSQYSATSWSAREVLGPPDVYPAIGDQQHAWASLTADTRDEWIEVGYANPTSIDAVEVYETFNPGAIDRVELTTVDGHKLVAYAGKAASSSTATQRFGLACTAEPIASVRVHLDSAAVPGWNELDAIGVEPCP